MSPAEDGTPSWHGHRFYEHRIYEHRFYDEGCGGLSLTPSTLLSPGRATLVGVVNLTTVGMLARLLLWGGDARAGRQVGTVFVGSQAGANFAPHGRLARRLQDARRVPGIFRRATISLDTGRGGCILMAGGQTMTHYIGMAGLHGCLPQTCASYESVEAAADSLAETHGLGKRRTTALRRDLSLELNLHRDGNEYAEIVECDCDDPAQHDD